MELEGTTIKIAHTQKKFNLKSRAYPFRKKSPIRKKIEFEIISISFQKKSTRHIFSTQKILDHTLNATK